MHTHYASVQFIADNITFARNRDKAISVDHYFAVIVAFDIALHSAAAEKRRSLEE